MKTFSKLIFILVLSGCGPSVDMASFSEVPATAVEHPGANEPAVRIIFHRDSFTNLEDFLSFQNTSFKCLGDMTRSYQVLGGDYSGVFGSSLNPIAFADSDTGDDLHPTYHPSFLKHVSVDTTRTYYAETVPATLQTDACSKRADSVPLPPSPCADFDPPISGPFPAPSPLLPSGTSPDPTPEPPSTPADINGLEFYRVRDPWCLGQGSVDPIDPELSKAYVGGVNLDLDRSKLGDREDLLMLITYQSFVEGDAWTYAMGPGDFTRLRVDLIATGRALDVLMNRPQPRVIGDLGEFSNALAPPILVKKIATLEDPFPSLKTESIVIPLSHNALIDRIRIERIRGTYQLYQIDLYRLGNRSIPAGS